MKGVEVAGGETYVHVAPEGAQSEALVKWVGQHPGRVINLHLCPKDCGNLSKDALVHCKGVKQWKEDQKEGWMDNLLGMGGLPPDVDELSRLRRRAEETGGEAPDRGPPRQESDTSEESKAKRRKKKKGKKVKKDKERGKISGTKELAAVFGPTALDPNPAKRKILKRRARWVAKRRNKKDADTACSTATTSDGSDSSLGEVGTLFGDEIKVKTVWKKVPGALTLNALEQMQNAVVTQTGQPWQLDLSAIPPIFSQYWRMALQGRMSGAMAREAHADGVLCSGPPITREGLSGVRCPHPALTRAGANFWRRTFLRGTKVGAGADRGESPFISSPVETLEASRLQREELRARNAASRPWEKKTEWDKRGEDHRGKGKGKDMKGKGKSKGNTTQRGGKDEEKNRK